MKLIKQLSEQATMSQVKQLTLKSVRFPQGFTKFMEDLVTTGLVPENYKREKITNGYRWADTRKTGGLLIETTEHPLLKGHAGDVTVMGVRDALNIFENIASNNDVEYEGAERATPKITHEYHKTLNPAIWNETEDGYKLDPEVREKLLTIAEEFKTFQKMADLEVSDIVLTGSCANYHWTKDSDLDLHLLMDLKKVTKQYGPLAGEYFEAKRKVWSDLHDISIRGIPVEPYMQDVHERHHATAIYSLEKDKWLMEPTHEEPTINDASIKTKLKRLMSEIDDVTASCNKADAVEALMTKIKKMRKTGLEASGEFSEENLVFKELRRNGYFEKLANCKTKAYDRNLSIEDEEWESLTNY